VALCDPKEHKEARNGLNPYFTKAYVAKMSHVVIEKVAHAVEFMNHRIKEGRVIDIQMLYRRIAVSALTP
jgi:cytochrome P450